jgi:predicted RNA-binding protein with TRAM domain
MKLFILLALALSACSTRHPVEAGKEYTIQLIVESGMTGTGAEKYIAYARPPRGFVQHYLRSGDEL